MCWIKKPWCISSLAVFGFTIYFLLRGNYEFLVYAAVLALLIWIIARTDKIFHYSNFAKWGFVVWLFCHMLGGAASINGTRLYDTILINIISAPYYLLRYDQIIHAFCYFVITLFVYSIIAYAAKPKTNRFLVIAITFAATMGISALNEIVELSTVILFNSSAAVGDYYNNALDLAFNAIGSLIALFFTQKK
ncbi:MAG: DUF2238 domain-containing protein [Candidatus Pacearchaeota archaeon]